MASVFWKFSSGSDQSVLYAEKTTITPSQTIIQNTCVIKKRASSTLRPKASQRSARYSNFKSIANGVPRCNCSRLAISTKNELYELYRKKIGLDCSIIALEDQFRNRREVRFPIHKIALSAHMDKSNLNIPNQIDLTNYQPSLNISLLRSVISFLYTKEIYISENNVEELLNIADALKLITLKNICCSFLNNPTPKNIIKYYVLAKKWNFDTIHPSLLNYAKQQMPNILLNPDLIMLDSDTLYNLLETLEPSHIRNVNILRALSKWFNHHYQHTVPNQTEGPRKILEIMDMENSHLADLQQLADSGISAVFAIDYCKKLLFENIKNQLFSTFQDEIVECPQSLQPPRQHFQIRHDTIYALLAPPTGQSLYDAIHTNAAMECRQRTEFKGWSLMECDTFSNWTCNLKIIPDSQCGAMSLATVPSSVAYLNERLYVLGGLRPHDDDLVPSTPSNTVLCYDLKTREWWKMCPMKHSREYFGMTTYNGYLYVIGGQGDGIRALTSCEFYLPHEDRWVFLRDLPLARQAAAVIGYQERILAVGGIAYINGQKTSLRNVEYYDLVKHRWSTLNPLPEQGRAFSSLLNINGKIYIIGGASTVGCLGTLQSISSILKYEVSSDTWTHVTHMTCPRHYFGTVIKDHGVYIIGGLTSKSDGSSIVIRHNRTTEYLSIVKGRHKATLVDQLPAPIFGTYSCAVVKD